MKAAPTASRPLRVAAIGLGWVTTHRHLPAMRRCRNIELVGVVDRVAGLAREVALATRVRLHHAGDDLAAIPWLDEVDAFSIGTHPASHANLVGQGLELGRHVITEKPFAMNIAEGEYMVRLARERRRVLAVVHNFQFARSCQKLRNDIADGRLGPLRFLHAQQLGNPARRLPTWHEELPFGLFYDESPHLLYLLRTLAPAPLRLLRAEMHPGGGGRRTPAWLSAHYAAGSGGIPVKLNLAFEAPLSEWHMTVAGERALGDVDVFRDIYMRLPNDGNHTTWPTLRTSLSATWDHWGQHLVSGPRHLAGSLLYGNDQVFRRFAVAALTGAPLEEIGAEDALAVLRMQHEILDAAERLG